MQPDAGCQDSRCGLQAFSAQVVRAPAVGGSGRGRAAEGRRRCGRSRTRSRSWPYARKVGTTTRSTTLEYYVRTW